MKLQKEKIALGIFIFSIIAVLVLFILMFQENLTGKVVEETKEQTSAGQITCSDSDGRNYNVKGIIDYCDANGCSSKEDFCSGKKLTEWYCENSEAKYEEHECEEECFEGVCLTLATKYKYVGSGGGGGGGASGGGTTSGEAVTTQTGQTYNLGELTSEQTLELSKSDSISFSITGRAYLLSLTDITETEVKISYEGSEITIKVGKETNNIPGIYLKLRAINIITNKAKLSLGLV